MDQNSRDCKPYELRIMIWEFQVWAEWESLGGIDGGDALENPFFEEVSATYGELDRFSFGLVEDHLTIGGKAITIGAGTYDLGDFLENNDDLLIAGSETLAYQEKIQFETDNPRQYPGSLP